MSQIDATRRVMSIFGCHIHMEPALEGLVIPVLKPEYSGITRSLPWLLILLDVCVARPSATMQLIMQYDECILALHEEGFQLLAPCQYKEIIENAEVYIFKFSEINSAGQNLK